MLLLIKSKADEETLKKVAEDLDGYIKFVVDVEEGILTAGGKMHFEGEQLLLAGGSRQENLWGGGLDLETGLQLIRNTETKVSHLPCWKSGKNKF